MAPTGEIFKVTRLLHGTVQVHNVTDDADWGDDQEDELAPTARHYDHYDHELPNEDGESPEEEESEELIDEDTKLKNERDLKWRAPNGFQHQETYDKEWIRIRDEFFSNTVFGNVDVDTREERATPNEYPLKNEKGVVIIENAACDLSGQPTEEGLWYKGPVRAVRYGLCDICSSPACGCLPRVEPLMHMYAFSLQVRALGRGRG